MFIYISSRCLCSLYFHKYRILLFVAFYSYFIKVFFMANLPLISALKRQKMREINISILVPVPTHSSHDSHLTWTSYESYSSVATKTQSSQGFLVANHSGQLGVLFLYICKYISIVFSHRFCNYFFLQGTSSKVVWIRNIEAEVVVPLISPPAVPSL